MKVPIASRLAVLRLAPSATFPAAAPEPRRPNIHFLPTDDEALGDVGR